MTAIVGILNKNAIVVASDSAETIGEGFKIYNNANKIFTLSKYHPVGIAVYNNAVFNSRIPWDIIIKMYRQHLGRNSKDTLKEYVDDFYMFLSTFKDQHLTKTEQDDIMTDEVLGFLNSELLAQIPNYKDTYKLKKEDLPQLRHILYLINQKSKEFPKIRELSSVTKEQFRQSTYSRILSVFKLITNKEELETIVTEVIDSLFEFFTRTIVKRQVFSGLVFFGYGKTEIYPSLYETIVYNSFCGQLYWELKDESRITNAPNSAFICPLAQKDVMDTYISGISLTIEETFINSTVETIKLVLDSIQNSVKKYNPELAAAVGKIDLEPILNQYRKGVSEFKQEHEIDPLMVTVSTLEKEDLAELAENLIALTSLKRRITPYIESVGGPVDVAIVSKGDGFIWKKRKHYFNPELNRSFFDKYYE